MTILDRYASAMGSRNLKSDARTSRSDADMLGAAGMAARCSPVAMGLARILGGDAREAQLLVKGLGVQLMSKASRLRQPLRLSEAERLAEVVLHWWRFPGCGACSSRGYEPVAGAPVLSTKACKACRGVARRPLERDVPYALRGLAQWLVSELEREASVSEQALTARVGFA